MRLPRLRFLQFQSIFRRKWFRRREAELPFDVVGISCLAVGSEVTLILPVVLLFNRRNLSRCKFNRLDEKFYAFHIRIIRLERPAVGFWLSASCVLSRKNTGFSIGFFVES